MRLIDADALMADYKMHRGDCSDCPEDSRSCGYDYTWTKQDVCGVLDNGYEVDAIPVKPLAQWLAGYAAPPAYALEAVTEGIDYASIAYTTNDLTGAWEYHLHTLMDNGLMEEDKGE